MSAILQPMLAASADNEEDLSNLLIQHGSLFMSEKIDGICTLKGSDGILYGRSGIPIANKHIQLAAKHIPKSFHMEATFHIDGHPGARPCLADVESILNSLKDAWPRRWTPVFYVFDFQCDTSLFFKGRYCTLREKYGRQPSLSSLIIHRQLLVHELITIITFFDRIVSFGGEGIILRAPGLPYKQGRSTLKEGGMVRYKKVTTDIARIIGFEPLQRHVGERERNAFGYAKRDSKLVNLKSVEELGALIVRHDKYGEFKIGSGFTDAQRKNMWFANTTLRDRLVEFEHRDLTHKNIPRNAVFKKLL